MNDLRPRRRTGAALTADDRPHDERIVDLRDHQAALAYLRTCRGDSDSGLQMRGLLAEQDAPAALCEFEDDEILDALAWRIARGDLTPAVRQRVYRSADLIVMPEPSDEEPVLAATKVTTWVEFQLLGEDNQPMPGERFELTLPSGAVQEGRLDARGLVRVDDIDESGQCTFSFPDLDKEAWEEV